MPNEIEKVTAFLSSQTDIQLAWIFGSVANQSADFESDLDVAVVISGQLTSARKMQLIDGLADCCGRPVDLIDLSQASPTLMKQVMTTGKVTVKKDTSLMAEYLKKLWFDQADWQPYRERILQERREAWIGK